MKNILCTGYNHIIDGDMTMENKEFLEALRSARSLVLYRNIILDPACRAWLNFVESVAGDRPADETLNMYCELFFCLTQQAGPSEGGFTGDAWQDHLLQLLLYDDNVFSRWASLYSPEKLGASLLDAARGDLARLHAMYRIDCAAAREAVMQKLGATDIPCGGLPLWKELSAPAADSLKAKNHLTGEIIDLLSRSGDWGPCLEDLARYYRKAGAGLTGRYRAFRWCGAVGRMEGIDEPDSIHFDDLVGYQDQRQQVVENTEKFLAGFPANNLLLYGDRGTGKSSTVKALLNQYAEQGLRLVEVPKSSLGDFPKIITLLRQLPQRFIIFVDDLSFEESEVEYKELKAVLEGGLASRPANVLIYATSNRRHLVRERFSDRDMGDELHGNDTVQEKLSLADRFGVTIFFTTPDRALYLKIVREMAKHMGLELAEGELERRALLWASWHNGLSGRTARQFIDNLSGGLYLQE
ncbi:ATP-binding protein [Pelotomaculum propionicicum]|uniref:ATP-binding protein n=1 Tax=Pelotomaculum propionicicum TaxID=258475 RepID=UPI003B7BEC29